MLECLWTCGGSGCAAGVDPLYLLGLRTEAGDVEWLLPSGGAKGDNAYTMAWHPSGRLVIAGSCAAPADFAGRPMASPGGAEAYGAVLVPAR